MMDWVGVCGDGLPLRTTTQLYINVMTSIITALYYYCILNLIIGDYFKPSGSYLNSG